MSQPIVVACRPTPDGYRCEVGVGRDAGATHHVVSVRAEDLARLAPGLADPAPLVEASFAFLLARESRESILARFDLLVIERYFPGYAEEMRRRSWPAPDEDRAPG